MNRLEILGETNKNFFQIVPDESIDSVYCLPSSIFSETPTSNFGIPVVTNNTRNFLSVNNRARIRQSGTIRKFKIKTGPSFSTFIGNITSLKIKVWRRNGGGTFDLVGQGEILSLINSMGDSVVSDLLSLPSDIQCIEGDFVGFEMISDGTSCTSMFQAIDNQNAASTRILDGTIGTSAIDFVGTGTANDAFLKIQLYGDEPYANYVSDSYGEGTPQSQGFYDDDVLSIDTSKQIPYKIKSEIGRSIQNNSLGANSKASDVVSNISDRIEEVKGKVLFLAIGTNDIAQGTSIATFQSNYSQIISTAISMGMRCVLMTIAPRTDLTDSEHLQRELFNDYILSLETRNNIFVVDLNRRLGQTRAGINKYNEWDILSSLNPGDNIHYLDTGYEIMKELILEKIQAF